MTRHRARWAADRRPLIGALMLSALLSGCSSGFREFLGVDEPESEASVKDLGNYHDPMVLLNRANSLFDKRNYLEAAMTYERFLDLHGLNRQADYAQFRVGVSYLKQFRTIDRDPEPVTKAYKAFQQFLSKYPDSPYVDEARAQQAIARGHLADYELFVGRFYYRQSAYPAAINRLEAVLKDYHDLPAAEPALFFLGEAYRDSGKTEQAKASFEQLLQRYPQSGYATRARNALTQLHGAA